MSVKFERDTFQQTASNVMNNAAQNAPLPGTSGKHPLAEKVGTALTGGAGNAGTKGYLAVRISVPLHSVARVVAVMAADDGAPSPLRPVF